MPAGGFKTFVAGEILTSSDTNDYLMQGILVFADASARNAAITSPVEGQFAYLSDVNELSFYDGSAWEEFSTDPRPAEVSGTTGSPGVATDGSATIYSFTGDGSITFSRAGFVELLMIGGGGGGGRRGGAGGGGGGFLPVSSAYFGATTFTVKPGAGGVGGTSSGADEGQAGGNGFVSSIGDFYVPGGGGGAGHARASGGQEYSAPGLNGGSGGGAGLYEQTPSRLGGLGFSPLGNNGGASAYRGAGGGGGAGAVGANGASSVGGAGGAGDTSAITGSLVFYSGGGGGSSTSGTPGAGGNGGGGAGNNTTSGVSGTANTGGGGGGTDTGTVGGNGGSGIVIVRVG